MKPWIIILASVGLVLLIALTLIFGESPEKVEANPVPKDLPKPVVGGIDVEVPLATSTGPKFLPTEISGDLSKERFELNLLGNRTQFPPVENPLNSKPGATTQLADDDLVLGVSLRQSARAYSLKQLAAVKQSVVNDTFEGEALVITWNSENRAAVVYHNPPGDVTLVFRSTGQNWNSDLVIQDMATESLWSQTLGRCIEGQLRGVALKAVPSVICTWKSWKQAYPDTTLATLPESGPDTAVTSAAQARSGARRSGSLLVISPKGEVEISRAELIEAQVLNKEIGEERIVVFYDEASDSAHAFNSLLIVPPALKFEIRGLQFAPEGQSIGWNIQSGGADGENNPARRLQPLIVLELPEKLRTVRNSIADKCP